MCDARKIPHLVHYEVRHEDPSGDIADSHLSAQGYGPDPELDGWTRFWRYIPAGERQTVASFPASRLISICEVADRAEAVRTVEATSNEAPGR